MEQKNFNLRLILILAYLVLLISAVVAGRYGQDAKGMSLAWVALLYQVIRAGTYVATAYLVLLVAERTRMQTLAIVGFLGFLDQVVIKTAIMIYEFWKNPAYWEGISLGGVLFGIVTSYIFFLPILLILGFFGTFLAEDHRKRTTRAEPVDS